MKKEPLDPGLFEFYYEKNLLKGKSFRDDCMKAVEEWLQFRCDGLYDINDQRTVTALIEAIQNCERKEPGEEDFPPNNPQGEI